MAAFLAPALAKSLEWVIFPVLHLLEDPMRHDATTFIKQTGFHPLIVALIGVGLAVVAFRAFRGRTQFSANLKAYLDRAARNP